MRSSLPLLPQALLVLALVTGLFTQGCAASADATLQLRDPEGAGQALALGVMGVRAKSAPSPTEPMEARRLRAVAGYIAAEVEERDPGHLDRAAADLASSDSLKAEAAWKWLGVAVRNASASERVLAAVKADPAFEGAHTLSLGGLGLRNTGGSGSPGSSSSGSGTVPDLGKGEDGRYGDDRTGLTGAAKDSADLAVGSLPSSVGLRAADLINVDNGSLKPDPESRLGAYAATAGYPDGTVGSAVHNAIGTIYGGLGTYGEEKIGRVFGSDEAQALYSDPVDSDSGTKMAQIEHTYWQNVAKEDPYSAGGQLGSAFNPTARDWLQRNVF